MVLGTSTSPQIKRGINMWFAKFPGFLCCISRLVLAVVASRRIQRNTRTKSIQFESRIYTQNASLESKCPIIEFSVLT